MELRDLLGNLLSRVGNKKILCAIPNEDQHLIRDRAYLRDWSLPTDNKEMDKGRRRIAWEGIENLQKSLLSLEFRVSNALDRLEIGEAVQLVVDTLKMVRDLAS